jgi:hypothetical protein
MTALMARNQSERLRRPGCSEGSAEFAASPAIWFVVGAVR